MSDNEPAPRRKAGKKKSAISSILQFAIADLRFVLRRKKYEAKETIR